jgi:hypothetical protein
MCAWICTKHNPKGQSWLTGVASADRDQNRKETVVHQRIAFVRRSVASRGPIIRWFSFLSILTVGHAFLLPSFAAGGSVGPASVSAYYGDEYHTSMLNPYPLTSVSSITYSGSPALNGQCVWINTGLNAFIAANPADGSGPSGQGWSYSWAGVAQEAAAEKGITVLNYNPWVVSLPTVTAANGEKFAPPVDRFGDDNMNEVGGAILNLAYTPGQNGAPIIPNLSFIQAFNGTGYGNQDGPALDNAGSLTTPFYGGGGDFAGTLPNLFGQGAGSGGGWFYDRPNAFENEYESNPVASYQFQVVLASDTVTQKPLGTDGAMVTQNAITLYGGEWWGYQSSASDVPEPSTLILAAFSGLVLLACQRRFA